jgi:hypothetical protein
MRKYVQFLLCLWLFSACTPEAALVQAPTAAGSASPSAAESGDSPRPSAEALSETLWASDPSLPQYDPESSAYAQFPAAIEQISGMGAAAIDAADDLAVAMRYPRPDSYLAAQSLLRLGPEITKITVPLLIDNLDQDAETRIYALILLASIGAQTSCAAGNIAPLLWDSDPGVRSAAALALEKITGEELVAGEYQVLISPSFLANSMPVDSPEGMVVESARDWWQQEGSKIDWHPGYGGICDP